MNIFQQIKSFLDQQQIEYQIKEHPPTRTSEESALHQGEPLKIGAKALLVKAKVGFYLAVIPANRRLDTKKLKEVLQSKSLRFATAEELLQLTGLVPGSVPPFGQILGISMVVDKALLEEEWMAFNAGSLTISIKMKVKDYLAVVKPELLEISIS